MVTSLPSLLSLPVTVLIGSIAGKKLSYRFCAIFGTVLILIAGIAPFFFSSSWILILFFRALVGIGVGFVAMRNSLIIKSVPDHKQAAIIGYGSSLMNAGGMMSGPIVGLLAGFGWKFPFLYDLIAMIPVLIMVFWLKEPKPEFTKNLPHAKNAENPVHTETTKNPLHAKNAENPVHTESSGNLSADKVQTVSNQTDNSTDNQIKNVNTNITTNNNWRVYFYIAMQFITTAALYPLLSGMSSYMAATEIGNAFVAGLTNSVYCLFGVLINLVVRVPVPRFPRHGGCMV